MLGILLFLCVLEHTLQKKITFKLHEVYMKQQLPVYYETTFYESVHLFYISLLITHFNSTLVRECVDFG